MAAHRVAVPSFVDVGGKWLTLAGHCVGLKSEQDETHRAVSSVAKAHDIERFQHTVEIHQVNARQGEIGQSAQLVAVFERFEHRFNAISQQRRSL